MPVHAILYPTLAVQLAAMRRPELAVRPIVMIAGVGTGATVTARCAAAGLLGVLPGMCAGEASRRAPGAVFLPDNPGERRALLANVAESIGLAGCGVADVVGDVVAVHSGRFVTPERVFAAARDAAPTLCVRTGSGKTLEEAVAVARASRSIRMVPSPEPPPDLLRLAG